MLVTTAEFASQRRRPMRPPRKTVGRVASLYRETSIIRTLDYPNTRLSEHSIIRTLRLGPCIIALIYKQPRLSERFFPHGPNVFG